MGLTTGQVITNCLRFYLNVGSDTVATDQNLRDRARFYLTILAKEVWDGAPYWFRLRSNAQVALTAGVTYGTMPPDFSHTGQEMNISILNFPFYTLDYLAPDLLYQNRRVLGLGNISGRPLNYTLQGQSSTGVPLIQIWPAPDINYTLIIDNYVGLMKDLVDSALAPTLAAGSATGLTGTYKYCVTFVTADGETEAGVASQPITVANTKISLSGIPVSPCANVTARKLYRTVASGEAFKFLTTISDNITTTYANDNASDGSLGAAPPTFATAVTGMEQFPVDAQERLFVEGLRTPLSTASGDLRDRKWMEDWRKEIARFWGEYKQGQNEPISMPRYGSIISHRGGFGQRWR